MALTLSKFSSWPCTDEDKCSKVLHFSLVFTDFSSLYILSILLIVSIYILPRSNLIELRREGKEYTV